MRDHASALERFGVATLATLISLAARSVHAAPAGAACNNLADSASCDSWAKSGECDANEGFMKRQCARSCDSCGWVSTYCTDAAEKHRPAKTGVGAINAVFEHVIQLSELGPTIHSSPDGRDGSFTGPWVVSFDRFVTDEEAEAFLSTTEHHFSRSLAGDVVSPVRTSQQAWCQVEPCVSHPLVHRVHERVVNVTGVPKPNGEFFQVLRYEPGQFYKVHHDQNAPADSLMGVRLFTFFIYLHQPAAGGHTRFPRLNVTVAPKKGSALLWPNVMDDNLRLPDMRTEHEAMPPEQVEGVSLDDSLKSSANLWLHNYDFRGPNTHGCEMHASAKRSAAAAAAAGMDLPLLRGVLDELPPIRQITSDLPGEDGRMPAVRVAAEEEDEPPKIEL